MSYVVVSFVVVFCTWLVFSWHLWRRRDFFPFALIGLKAHSHHGVAAAGVDSAWTRRPLALDSPPLEEAEVYCLPVVLQGPNSSSMCGRRWGGSEDLQVQLDSPLGLLIYDGGVMSGPPTLQFPRPGML